MIRWELSAELLEEIKMDVEGVADIIESEFPEVDKEQRRYLAESALVDILNRYYNSEYINWKDLEEESDILFK